MPSLFSPALMTTTSERISTTIPETMEPGFRLMFTWLCSNNSAKLSVMLGSKWERGRHCRAFLWCAQEWVGPAVRGEAQATPEINTCREAGPFPCAEISAGSSMCGQQRQHFRHHELDTKAGRIDQYRVAGGFERSHRAFGIAS